jgi:sensor c-di-GMP phosphodiesterase-like protein
MDGMFNRRSGFSCAVTLIAAFLGALGGYFLALGVTVWVAGTRLDQYAGRIVGDTEAWDAELRTALAAVNASPHAFCSGSEVDYFRKLIFNSDFLKDAGRIRDGRFSCSAAMGQPAQSRAQLVPNFVQQDGSAIYVNPAPYGRSGATEIAFKSGSSYVVFTPNSRLHSEPGPMHFTLTAINAPNLQRGKFLGESSNVDPQVLSAEGRYKIGDTLYATRCSIALYDCATAFTTIPEMVQADPTRFYGCIGLTTLIVALMGFAFSLFYRRTKSLEQQLRRAIRGDKLGVVYQPIVELATGKILGAEALARWTDEEGQAIGPDVFVKIAEERGFVGQISRLVLRRILRDFGHFMRAGFRVSINLTAADFADREFLEELKSSLARAGVSTQCLTIEITESSTVRQKLAIEAIKSLRVGGHHVHIDDFGTGYSSLAYLQDLSVDAIKIDKAFTQSIGTQSVTTAILPQILAMAEALNLHVVVEGVETVEQAKYFARSRIPVMAQGWLYGRPIAPRDFLKLLKQAPAAPFSASEAEDALTSVA